MKIRTVLALLALFGLVALPCTLLAASPEPAAPPATTEPAPPAQPPQTGQATAPRAGCIPNTFTDSNLDEPLLHTASVFDLYAALVNYLQQSTAKDAPAIAALEKAKTFIESQQQAVKQNPDSARPYRMPMSIDMFMKHLNSCSTKDGSSLVANVGDNPKAKLYTAAMLPLLHLRGITFRLRPIVSQSFVLHSMIISALRVLKQQLDVMSGTNGLALFHFVTYPMSFGERGEVQFNSIGDVQNWVLSSFIPTINHSIAIVESVASSGAGGFRESLNMQIFLKAERAFPNESKESAYRWFGMPEVHAALAQLYALRASLHAFCAYNLDDLTDATNELSNTVVKDFFGEKFSLGGKPRVGTTSAKRYQILEKYSKLFTLKSGEESQAALADLRQAVAWGDKAMHGFFAAGGAEDNTRVTILRWVHAIAPDYENKFAPQLRALVSGPTTLSDFVGGSNVDVDLPGFLQAPPADLKAFFPAKFDLSNKYIELQSAGDMLVYTNYDYGRPVGWKLDKAADSWGKLFPNIKKTANAKGDWEEPLVIFRDVSRTYLGWLFTSALSGAVN